MVTNQIGNPLYDVTTEHGLAVAAVALLPVLAWLARVIGGSRMDALTTGYGALAPIHRLTFWLLAVTSAVHLGLAAAHGGPGIRLAFLVASVLLAHAARRLALGRSWRLMAGVILFCSLVAYWVAVVGGEYPDQVGLATKLVEVTALTIVLRPADAGQRVRGWSASAITIVVVIVTGLSAWVGTVALAGGVAGHTHDQNAGMVPAPGTVMSAPAQHEASPDQIVAARRLLEATTVGIARYADPALATADGYVLDTISGLDIHASNAAYEADREVLDPARPETLVYAAGPRGLILLGAMFQMPSFREPGPAVGGPLTVWHGHEQICISLVPPGMTGIVSPLGGCPVGSLMIPRTIEMIHIWTVPGAPQPFGDLDDGWRRDYVELAEPG